MRLLQLIVVLLLCVGYTQAQEMSISDLKAKKAEKMGAADALIAEADGIQAQIDALPGWTTTLAGTLGGNFSGFNDWFATENQNSAVNSFVFDVFATARYNDSKQFLYNDLSCR
jgi:hypothetical protein